MKELDDIRSEIDGIDDRLAALIKRRLDIVGEVAEAKRRMGTPVSDPAREREIMTRVAEKVGPEYENGARLIFTTLFGIAKARQRAMIGGESELVSSIRREAGAAHQFPTRAVVACPGVEGSYAQQAVSALFPIPTILFFTSFEKVFEAVEKGLCPYGILPIENSAAGSVPQVYDLMVSHRFHIVRALRLKVDHVLLANRGAHSVKCATMLNKPSRRKVAFEPDYSGLIIPDYFVVGYGLDYNEKYRTLPFIGILKPEIYTD